MRSSLAKILEGFAPISLVEMDSVALMERLDVKYAFDEGELPEFLNAVRPHYRVLDHAGTRISAYETLYYDSAGYDLYDRHHDGRSTRFKVRARCYVDSDVRFFEIKSKNNRGYTIKHRVTTPAIDDAIPRHAAPMLLERTGVPADELRGAMWTDFSRITLVGKQIEERMTVDVGISFRIGDRRADMGRLAMVEIKRDRLRERSPAVEALRIMRIKERPMSKYCIGIALLSEPVKANNFKQNIRRLQKLVNVA